MHAYTKINYRELERITLILAFRHQDLHCDHHHFSSFTSFIKYAKNTDSKQPKRHGQIRLC